MKNNPRIASLENQIHLLETIIAKIPGHIYWKDKEGKFLGCNDLQAVSAGYSTREEMVGKNDYDMPWRDQADQLREIDRQVMESGVMIVAEEESRLSSGKKAIFLSHKIPLRDDNNNTIGILGISIDITQQKEAEAREKNALEDAVTAKAKAQAEEEMRQAVMIFAGSIAHDLRTPLATVAQIGSCIETILPVLTESYQRAEEAELPLNGFLSPIQFDVLSRVPHNFATSVNDMNIFIDKTLNTLSRVVTDSLTKEDLELCSANYCIHNTLQRYPFAENEHQLVLWNRSSDFKFLGNPVLFIRVISNLLKNALYQIHQNKKGQITIATEQNGKVNIIRIRDTAGGAPPEVVENLFKGYKTTKKEGTGVGLAFCKLTLKSFGGNISCESVYGDYIEFILTFPMVS